MTVRPSFLNRPIYTFMLLCLGVATHRAKIVLKKNAKLFLEISSCLCGFAYTRRRPEFPGRNVVFNKTIAGRRKTLLLNVKPARMSVKRKVMLILFEQS